MASKNWENVANREFEAMSRDWQEEWADLRDRVKKPLIVAAFLFDTARSFQ